MQAKAQIPIFSAGISGPLPEEGAPPIAGPRARAWRRFYRNRPGVISAGFLSVLILVAIAAPLISRFITHHSPNQQDLLASFAPPSTHHWLGTDELGRDTVTRLVWGTRTSIEVGFLAVFLSASMGTTIGLIAGYYGGVIDSLLTRVIDVVLSVPPLFMLLLLTTLLPLSLGPVVLHHSPATLAVAIALIGWGRIARIARAEALAIRSRPFVEAAVSLGASDRRIMVRHILPNLIPTLSVIVTVGTAQIILLEAALDFIGVGVQLPTPSWGNMLFNAQTYFYRAPMLAVEPGILIAATVLAMNLFGNALRSAVAPNNV